MEIKRVRCLGAKKISLRSPLFLHFKEGLDEFHDLADVGGPLQQELDLPVRGTGNLAARQALEKSLDLGLVTAAEHAVFTHSLHCALALGLVADDHQFDQVLHHAHTQLVVVFRFALGLEHLQLWRIHGTGGHQGCPEFPDPISGNELPGQPQDRTGKQTENPGDQDIENGMEQGQNHRRIGCDAPAGLQKPVATVCNRGWSSGMNRSTPSTLTSTWTAATRRASRPATSEASTAVDVVPMLAPRTTAAPVNSVITPPGRQGDDQGQDGRRTLQRHGGQESDAHGAQDRSDAADIEERQGTPPSPPP